ISALGQLLPVYRLPAKRSASDYFREEGNRISTAVLRPRLGFTNWIFAPYSANIARVIVRPSPIPWPSLESGLSELDAYGSNHSSPAPRSTAMPVFSTRTIVEPF